MCIRDRSTPIAGMTIPSEGLSELAKQSGSTVSFTAESVTVTGAGGSKSDAIRLDVADVYKRQPSFST